VALPETAHLAALLRRSAARSPQAEALRDEAGALSYQALDRQSDRLALALMAQGIGRGQRVGIYLAKSCNAVVALFGILKCGAAYVPLDPDSPATRLALMVEDAALAALIGDGESLDALLPHLRQPPPLPISVAGEVTAAGRRSGWQPNQAPPVSTPPALAEEPTALAYILYTSGSTGEPKGVAISHAAALAFVHWAVGQFALRPEDRLACSAPLHFDLSIFDLLAGIAVGATVALVPATRALFPYALAEWLAHQRISVWYSVPSALIRLLHHGDLASHDLSALRLVLFAGEPFPLRELNQLRQVLPGPTYYNLYGPTETNVCTAYPLPPGGAPLPAPCPIGAARPGMVVYALDEAGASVAVGECGELYIGGDGLMEGYWHRPAATAAAFCRGPAGERLYRSGDRVRREAEGGYSFIGRRDAQVKVRGYRVELGEIEASLHDHPQLYGAAVVPLADSEGGQRLLAYYVPMAGAPVAVAELIRYCRARLPAYMVPERWEACAALPLTTTGKLDRQRLRALAAAVSVK